MRMTFFWTPDIGEFFFPGLEINTVTSLTILCGVVALFAMLYEGIKVYSASSRARLAREHIAAVSCAPSESANLLVTEQTGSSNSFSKRFCRLINETIVFFFHNSVGYAVMLSVMVYSGWLFLTVVLAMGFGYFFFGHIAMKINMESIQARTTLVVCSASCAEAGSSMNASKTPSPARSVPSELNEYQQSKSITTTATCHDNQAMCGSQTSAECHQEKKESAKQLDENVEGDCSCRL